MQFSYSGVNCIGVSRSRGKNKDLLPATPPPENALSWFWTLVLIKNIGMGGVRGPLPKISH